MINHNQRPADLDWRAKTHVMAVINATPNSFSGDGLLDDGDPVEAAVVKARRSIAEGADILDVGGVATFPGAPSVAPEEESARIVPVVRALRAATDAPISIDTSAASVADDAIRAGASLVNSEWGLQTVSGEWNTALGEVIAKHRVTCVLTHNRAATVGDGPFGPHVAEAHYDDVVEEVFQALAEQARVAQSLGIEARRILVDPGIGKGKTPEQSIRILRNLARYNDLGFPVLLAASRKSLIGYVLGGSPSQRDDATIGISAFAASVGCSVVRVHDVARNAQAVRFMNFMMRELPPEGGNSGVRRS